MGLRPGTHNCPRNGCRVIVSNAHFACLKDWRVLSEETKSEIIRTRRLLVLDPKRRAAFRMAEADWEGK